MADRRRAPGHASAWQADPWRTAQLLRTLVSGDRTGQVLEATSRGIQRVMKRETGSATMVIFTSSGRAGDCIHLIPNPYDGWMFMRSAATSESSYGRESPRAWLAG
jgi:hypothetical protein